MSLTQAQVQFAAEFATLVVVASALALLVLRPDGGRISVLGRRRETASSRPGPRHRGATAVAGLALVALGAAAFAHGSVLVSGSSATWVGLGRMAAALVALVTFPYIGARPRRSVLSGSLIRLGFAAWAAAGASEWASAPAYAVDALLGLGAVLVAAAVTRVATRSIAVRVATSGAAALLLVVVVVSLGLSSVISSSLERQELARLGARAAVEKIAANESRPVANYAQLIQAGLAATFSQPVANPLVIFATGTGPGVQSAAAQISGALGRLAGAAPVGKLVYLNADGSAFAAPPGSVPPPSAPHPPASCSGGQRGLYHYASGLVLAASSPVCSTAGTLLGTVVVEQPLDAAYLAGRFAIDPTVGLALIADGEPLARAGLAATGPSPAALAARVAPGPGQSLARAEGSRFVDVVNLAAPGAGRPLFLVLEDQADRVASARDQLFRTLFLIAFGGTVVALGLAIFTGDRITAGLRRLTGVAAAIESGDAGVRAAVPGHDEVATLGSAFDAMLDSVSAQAAALTAAASDEARLRNRLEAVVAGMTDALVAVDTFGCITDFNRAAVELTGIEGRRAVGAAAEAVLKVRNDDGAPVTHRLFRPAQATTVTTGRLVGSGGEVPVAVSSGPLLDADGQVAGMVAVFRDMRREQEVEQMKTEFLSRVGHELRTPLTGIMGYADILLRRPVPPEKSRAWYEDILRSARRLLRIVEMLEFFASEGAGRIVLRPEPVDARALVNGIASSWSGRLPENLSLGRRLPKEDVLVSADRRWLTLAVEELLDNAVKFSPEGGRILLKVDVCDDAVEISVTDQGMGMSPQQYEVIFGDFVQGDSSDTRRFGGLGLGLAVVQRVVEGHGGTIRARSVPGRGSTFIISMPSWAPPGPTGGPAGRTDIGGPGGRPPRRARPLRARRR